MSKLKKPILILLLMCSVASAFARECVGQYVNVSVEIDTTTRIAAVHGKWTAAGDPRRSLSFLPIALGASDLGSRVSTVALYDNDGRPVAFRRFNSSEYVAESGFSGFSYKVDLRPGKNPRSAAHSSWIADEEGLIFPEDLIPISASGSTKGAIVSFKMPPEWQIISTEQSEGAGKYTIENVERAVFVIGKKIRESKLAGSTLGPSVAISGEWLFSDEEAMKMSADIYGKYLKIFGTAPRKEMLVVILPMPQPGLQKGTWEAETRGSTVVIASADMPFKSQSIQRLHEQLRHEIFHLWLPNGVNLTGRYDWFYEGFALYQSLKTGVSLNQIRFEDFLDTLSRAHNIDRSQTRRRSLIEASQERWSGADTQVYARGMVVAFLCDLILLRESGGRKSVESVIRKIFDSHKHPNPASDANAAILKILEADARIAKLADDYIRGSVPIDWSTEIESAGIENEPGTSRTSLRIKSRLTGRQKALLDKLGYNNWRKLTRK